MQLEKKRLLIKLKRQLKSDNYNRHNEKKAALLSGFFISESVPAFFFQAE